MVSLLAIGFGMLVLAIRLMMVSYVLRYIGRDLSPLKNGFVLTVIGFISFVFGIVRGWSHLEGIVIISAGATVMLLGLSWLVQGAVQKGWGTQRQVWVGAWITAVIGCTLIAAYFIAVYWVKCAS